MAVSGREAVSPTMKVLSSTPFALGEWLDGGDIVFDHVHELGLVKRGVAIRRVGE